MRWWPTTRRRAPEKRPLLDVNDSAPSARPGGLGQLSPSHFRGLAATVLFSWLDPLLRLGAERPLEHEDLYQLDAANRAQDASERLLQRWEHEQQRSLRPSLTRVLCRTYGAQVALAAALKLVHDVLQFVPPMLLKAMIAYLRSDDAPIAQGLLYVAVIVVAGVVQSFTLRNYFFYCFQTGMRVRSAICTAVYRKSLLLSTPARQKKTIGEITNLMSIDAQRLQELPQYINGVWYTIFQITVACYLLWRQLGIAALAGVAVIVLMLPLTTLIAQFMRKLQLRLMKIKDDRIKVCHEVLAGMKVIKLQAWENAFTRRVMEFRADELRKLQKYLYARSASMTLFSAIPSLVTVASFLAYVLLGHTLDLGTALTSLALFNILRFPLFMLPQVLNSVVEAGVSIERLRDFFTEEERQVVSEGELSGVGVKLVDAGLTWDPNPGEDIGSMSFGTPMHRSGRFSRPLSLSFGTEYADTEGETEIDTRVLHNLRFEATSGQLWAIVGSVGAGKSTLLNAFLGEAICIQGRVFARGSIAYVSQQPFLESATVRSNITFGKPFDRPLYEKAILASALQKDLAIFPAGDMTEIGERGITLSGGQRTRIALARAVYQDADIYLLDDILSAVDSQVGHEIFEQCIRQTLRDKLVLLVTHSLTVLPRCDRICVLERGTIAEQGTYDNLLALDGVLARIVRQYTLHDPDAMMEENEDEMLSQMSEDGVASASFPVVFDSGDNRSRVSSTHSAAKTVDVHADESEEEGRLIADEDRATGDVRWDVYMTWINAFGGIRAILWIATLFVIVQFLNLASTFWLSYWSEHAATDRGAQMSYWSVFVAMNAAYCLGLFVRAIASYLRGLRASKILFKGMLSRLIRAPLTFFETTPLGRIVNRLSKDVYTVDEGIPATWSQLLNRLISVVATLVTISYVTPLFLVVLIPIAVGYYASQRYFIKTSRELQRLDSISRSPVFALLSETLDGLATIRAYRIEQQLRHRQEALLDRNQRAYFLNFAANCWLSLRLELVGTLIAAGAALAAVLGQPVHASPAQRMVFAGLAGVSLSYAFSITRSLSWTVRMVSQLQTQMVSVERIQNYSEMPTEAALLGVGKLPREEWPLHGEIVWKKVNMRYREGLPCALRDVSVTIRAHERVGIAGRTGSGKSSLVVALLRLVELESGSILIDGVDVGSLGLHDLRSKIAIIPQDPVLFSGTIRTNIDPFDQYTDDQLWAALRRAHLRSLVQSLEQKVDERGANFSVGERQLLCIARALLKRSRIVVMDEATASVDSETDHNIQQSLRDDFKDSTCLTIAHRLNTILNSDRILVMDKGRVAEFDTPDALLHTPGGLFQALVEHWRHRQE